MPGVGRYGALLDAIHGVRWPARRVVHAGLAGAHPSRQLGLAAEFTAYRPYRQGDDPQHLDWKLLARTDRAYQRISLERGTLRTTLVVDASSSMAFPPGDVSKWSRACELAVGLAAIAQSAGDPVGLIVTGADTGFAPRTRRGVVAQVAAILDGIRPDGDAGLDAVLRRVDAGGRIVVLSDFLDRDPEATVGTARTMAAEGAELTAIHVVAREELEPADWPFEAVDPEDPALRRAFGERAVEGYRAAFASWRAQLARGWRAAGAVFEQVDTDEPPDRAIRRIVQP